MLHLEVWIERQGDDVEDGRHDVNEVDAAADKDTDHVAEEKHGLRDSQEEGPVAYQTPSPTWVH